MVAHRDAAILSTVFGTFSAVLVVALPVAAVTAGTWIAVGAVAGVTIALLITLRWLQSVIVRRLKVRTYTADMIRRFAMAVVALVSTFYVLDLLEVEAGPLVGGLGISGIIAAIALQPVIGNFVGSMLLHGTRAFRPGDEIESNGVVGTVVDISHRAVEILDFDGNRVYLPNNQVLDSTLINLTADNIRRTTFEFLVGYDTDLRLIRDVLVPAIHGVEMVVESPPVEVLVVNLADSGIELRAHFWHPAEERSARRTASEAAIVIRETLAEHDVTIPYPQRVLHGSPDVI